MATSFTISPSTDDRGLGGRRGPAQKPDRRCRARPVHRFGLPNARSSPLPIWRRHLSTPRKSPPWLKYDFDLFVLGAGSGGVRAARMAALSGAKRRHCRGTPRRRNLRHPRLYSQEVHGLRLGILQHISKRPRGTAGPSESRPSTGPAFVERRDIEIARLSSVYVTNLQNAGADLAHGRAELVDAHTFRMVNDDKTFTADKVLIATGGWPYDADGPAGHRTGDHLERSLSIWTNLPKRMVIAGGGYIAVEFAGIFNGLGRRNHPRRCAGPTSCAGFDNDVRAHLTDRDGAPGDQGHSSAASIPRLEKTRPDRHPQPFRRGFAGHRERR